MPTTLFIFGGRSTALEIAEVARRFLQPQVSKVYLVVPEDEPANGQDRIRQEAIPDLLRGCQQSVGFILSMWDRAIRRKHLEFAVAQDMVPQTVIHPMASVSETAEIGRGVYIAANAVVSSFATVNDHVVVNFSATIGHDSTIGEHSFVNPGARISGNVTVGDRVLVGANAVVYQGRNVGDDVLVDALTYVDRDIDSNMICSNRQEMQLKVYRRVF